MDDDLTGTTVLMISAAEKLRVELADRLRVRGMTVTVFGSLSDTPRTPPPHVVVVDLDQEGMQLIRATSERFQASRLLAVSGAAEPTAREVFSQGAHGFMASWEPVWTLESAVTLLARGGSGLSLPALHSLLQGTHSVPDGERSVALAADRGLTARQFEVLQLVARGFTDTDIADTLTLSVRTVNRHVADVLMKLECDGRREAALMIFGVVPPSLRTRP